jgi:hypothetical protein
MALFSYNVVLICFLGQFALEINTTLLREKFIIRDLDREGDSPLVAMSNRLALSLTTDKGEVSEVFIIRAQNMHCCIRMAAQILQSFMRAGPLLVRAEAYDFAEAWGRSCSEFEIANNLQRWAAVYSKGKVFFEFGARHPFLDVIEKCDAKNPGNYDRSIGIAEETFSKMGRKVGISYESNIGMVLNVKPDVGRCGLIHRGPEKNSTFNFTVEPNADSVVSPVLCMNICAAFLEGIQLAFKIGMTNDKLRLLLIEKASTEARQNQLALQRLAELNMEVRGFENRVNARFRPEKPEFSDMVSEAERFHRRMHEAKKRKF